MKKIIAIAMMVALTLSLGMAQAEANVDFAKRVLRNNVHEVQVDAELQEKADAIFGGDMSINIAQIEVKKISTGDVKYQSTKIDERSWFQKAWDFVTFWD